MKKIVCILISALGLTSLAGCGGGGGGGGGGSGSRIGKNTPGLRVIQASIDTAPLQFANADMELSTPSVFGKPVYYGRVTEGPFNVGLQRANTAERVLTVPVTVEEKDRKTILVYGLSENDLFAQVFDDDPPEVDGSEAALRVYNGVVGAGAVMVSVGGQFVGPIGYGDASEFVTIPSGPVDYRVSDAGSDATLFRGSAEVVGGKIYTIAPQGERFSFITSPFFENQ